MNENVEYYEKYFDENFIDKTVDFLRASVEIVRHSSPYKDLDDARFTDGNLNNYYEDITKFLNKKSDVKEEYIYPNPNEYNYPYAIVYDSDGNKRMYLRTDQFGFSFANDTAYDERHPYGRYLRNIIKLKDNKEISDDEFTTELEFIANCVNDTRTIGGSFIWPVVRCSDGKYKSVYNTKRGNNSYIEDRADITLWEIKKYYEIKETGKEGENKLILLKSEKDKKEIRRWLDSFEKFERYIEFFNFVGNFVQNIDGELQIVDIVNSNIEKGYYHPLSDDKSEFDKIKEIEKFEDLKRVLNNVRLLTLMRSKAMEKIIKC